MRVYDNSPATDSTSAAYQHSQLINIMELPSPYPSSIISSIILLPSGKYSYLTNEFNHCFHFRFFYNLFDAFKFLFVHPH